MGESSQPGEIAIKVYSWPSLWVYWPMYVALALSEEANPNWVFQIDSDHAGSDREIRQQLDKHLKEDSQSLALALCEPGSIESISDAEVARIPLLWRMPHWKISLSGSRSTSGRILCYPKHTTSGDYVRDCLTVANESPAIADGSLTAQLLSNRAASAVTFTPYHCFEEGLSADARIYPGPYRDVTSMLIPTARVGGPKLAEVLLENTKHVLHELALTNGDEERVRQLVAKHHDRISCFYGQGSFPQENDLARALTEYVRQGCYFPYRVVSSALLGELIRISTANIRRASKRAEKQARKDLMGFLGLGMSWSNLSFANRREVLRGKITIGGRPHDLLDALQHKSRKNVQHLLRTADVSIDGGGKRFVPESFKETSCYLVPAGCLGPNEDACVCWKPNEHPGTVAQDNCFACTLVCSPKRIMDLARATITANNNIKCEISPSYCGVYADPYICWDDIKELVDVWVEESVSRETTELLLHMCLEKKRCCFGIYKKGDVSPGSGKGMATQRLSSWAKNHAEGGRQVEWCGFWRPNGPERICGNASNFVMNCVIDDKKQWEFGYMAVFNWGPDEAPHS